MRLDWEVVTTEKRFEQVFPEVASQQLLVIDTEFTKEAQYGKAVLLGICAGYPIGS